MRRNIQRLAFIVALVAVIAISWPSAAYAQRHWGHVGSRVVVVGSPYFYDPFYGPWLGYQWGYPYPYPPYGGYRFAPPDASLRIEVEPKNASVFVDGYFAGTVDDFDGVFQRLHVQPGEHEIVIYLEGYRSIHERLYLGPNTSKKISHHMEKLGAGEPNEPRPVPAAEPREPEGPPPPQGPPPSSRRRAGPAPRPGPGGPPPVQAGRSGTVAIRVQPDGAEILIDGERWAGGSEDERLVVQLSEGPHRIEVQKEGFRRVSIEVQVRRAETTPVNISLSRQ